MPAMTSEELKRGIEFEKNARERAAAESLRWEWYRIGAKVLRLRRRDDGTLQKKSGVLVKGARAATVCFSCSTYICDGHGEDQDCPDCQAAHERSRKFFGN